MWAAASVVGQSWHIISPLLDWLDEAPACKRHACCERLQRITVYNSWVGEEAHLKSSGNASGALCCSHHARMDRNTCMSEVQ